MADWVVVAQPRFASEAEAIREMLEEEGIVADVVERADPIAGITGPSSEIRVVAELAPMATRLIAGWRGQVTGEASAPVTPSEPQTARHWRAIAILSLALLASVVVNVWLYDRWVLPWSRSVWYDYDATGFQMGESYVRSGTDRAYRGFGWSRDKSVVGEWIDDDTDGWEEHFWQRVSLQRTNATVVFEVQSSDLDEDGKFELIAERRAGQLLRLFSDSNRDGLYETEEDYVGGDLRTRCEDQDKSGSFESCTLLDKGKPIARSVDSDEDGFFETNVCLVPRPACPLR